MGPVRFSFGFRAFWVKQFSNTGSRVCCAIEGYVARPARAANSCICLLMWLLYILFCCAYVLSVITHGTYVCMHVHMNI